MSQCQSLSDQSHDEIIGQLTKLIEDYNIVAELHPRDQTQEQAIGTKISQIVDVALTSDDADFIFKVAELVDESIESIEDDGFERLQELWVEAGIRGNYDAQNRLGSLYTDISNRGLGSKIAEYRSDHKKLTAQVKQLTQDNSELRRQNAELQEKLTHLQFAPEGEGYHETKQHFESMQKKLKPKKSTK